MLPSTSHFYIHPDDQPDPAITGMVGGGGGGEEVPFPPPPHRRHATREAI